mmetsp:Transcript_15257/g.59657  ORF Transcript_15257/g.59657 Transcript_15257/m.59657 type:complete len:347 (-) Transcript_15257:26-1066(-)
MLHLRHHAKQADVQRPDVHDHRRVRSLGVWIHHRVLASRDGELVDGDQRPVRHSVPARRQLPRRVHGVQADVGRRLRAGERRGGPDHEHAESGTNVSDERIILEATVRDFRDFGRRIRGIRGRRSRARSLLPGCIAVPSRVARRGRRRVLAELGRRGVRVAGGGRGPVPEEHRVVFARVHEVFGDGRARHRERLPARPRRVRRSRLAPRAVHEHVRVQRPVRPRPERGRGHGHLLLVRVPELHVERAHDQTRRGVRHLGLHLLPASHHRLDGVEVPLGRGVHPQVERLASRQHRGQAVLRVHRRRALRRDEEPVEHHAQKPEVRQEGVLGHGRGPLDDHLDAVPSA